jgi:peroxiredoxin
MSNQPFTGAGTGAPDWSLIPAPEDDGAADHLTGVKVPDVALASTDGGAVSLADVAGRVVIYIYPMTGQPNGVLPDGWDGIPGARGCTPQSCSFRDHFGELQALGVGHVFGLSTQDTDYQREMATRLHLPFPVLSDADGALTAALNLPVMQVEGRKLLKRMAWVIEGGVIVKTFYPVFPPDQNADDVLAWLRGR